MKIDFEKELRELKKSDSCDLYDALAEWGRLIAQRVVVEAEKLRQLLYDIDQNVNIYEYQLKVREALDGWKKFKEGL